jgi:hypothetical protein
LDALWRLTEEQASPILRLASIGLCSMKLDGAAIRVLVYSAHDGSRLPAVAVVLSIGPSRRFDELAGMVKDSEEAPDGYPRAAASSTEEDLSLDLASDSMPQLRIAMAITDHAGYAKLDLACLCTGQHVLARAVVVGVREGSLDLFVEVEGDPASRVGLLDDANLLGNAKALARMTFVDPSSNSDDDALAEAVAGALFCVCRATSLTADLHRDRSGTAGTVERPDACDYRLSPDSFYSRRPIGVGADGCEHLTPASLPLQQFSFYQAVIFEAEAAVEDGIGSSALTFLPADSGRVTASGSVDITSDLAPEDNLKAGEVLHFEQTWRALGHSLGEIKYSLPLAPGEAVRLAMVDWNRSDAIKRKDATETDDSLKHRQSFNRDIGEIVNGSLDETQAGGSEIGGVAAGIDGMYKGDNWGVSAAVRGGYTKGAAHSTGNREIAGDSNQAIHASTLQRTSLSREQYSTVIVQATQAESNTLSTRIVANMNRAHALTIQYYEVLRHFVVRTAFVRRSPALFVPFKPFVFDAALARRLRQQLEPVLLDPRRAAGFDALARLEVGDDAYAVDSEPEIAIAPATLPGAQTERAYSAMLTASGGTAPYDFVVAAGALPQGLTLSDRGLLSGTPLSTSIGTHNFSVEAEDNLGRSGLRAYTISVTSSAVPLSPLADAVRFRFESAPNFAAPDTAGSVKVDASVDGMGSVQLLAVATPAGKSELFMSLAASPTNWQLTDSNVGQGANMRRTVISPWLNLPTTVDLRNLRSITLRWKPVQLIGAVNVDGWNLKAMRIEARAQDGRVYAIVDHRYVSPVDPADTSYSPFPQRGVNWGQAAYDERTNEDAPYRMPPGLPSLGAVTPSAPAPAPAAPTPPASAATEAKRADSAKGKLLIDHLNDNQVYYNAAVWAGMDARERRMRLAQVAGRYIGGLGDQVVAISGNLLGFVYTGGEVPERENERCQAEEGIVTLPTRGVFAEAHLGNCNAAELRDITRYWAMNELPVSLLPNIDSLKPAVLGQTPGVTPQPMQGNPLSVVDAPRVPDPTGLADLLKVLGTANVFRDMSTMEQVNNILGKFIEAAKPPSLNGATGTNGSASGTSAGSSGAGGTGSGSTGAATGGASGATGGSSAGGPSSGGSGGTGGSATGGSATATGGSGGSSGSGGTGGAATGGSSTGGSATGGSSTATAGAQTGEININQGSNFTAIDIVDRGRALQSLQPKVPTPPIGQTPPVSRPQDVKLTMTARTEANQPYFADFELNLEGPGTFSKSIGMFFTAPRPAVAILQRVMPGTYQFAGRIAPQTINLNQNLPIGMPLGIPPLYFPFQRGVALPEMQTGMGFFELKPGQRQVALEAVAHTQTKAIDWELSLNVSAGGSTSIETQLAAEINAALGLKLNELVAAEELNVGGRLTKALVLGATVSGSVSPGFKLTGKFEFVFVTGVVIREIK